MSAEIENIDWENMKRIVGNIGSGVEVKKQDKDYIEYTARILAKELAEEKFPFPAWMQETFIGYIVVSMIAQFILDNPVDFVRSYICFVEEVKNKNKKS